MKKNIIIFIAVLTLLLNKAENAEANNYPGTLTGTIYFIDSENGFQGRLDGVKVDLTDSGGSSNPRHCKEGLPLTVTSKYGGNYSFPGSGSYDAEYPVAYTAESGTLVCDLGGILKECGLNCLCNGQKITAYFPPGFQLPPSLASKYTLDDGNWEMGSTSGAGEVTCSRNGNTISCMNISVPNAASGVINLKFILKKAPTSAPTIPSSPTPSMPPQSPTAIPPSPTGTTPPSPTISPLSPTPTYSGIQGCGCYNIMKYYPQIETEKDIIFTGKVSVENPSQNPYYVPKMTFYVNREIDGEISRIHKSDTVPVLYPEAQRNIFEGSLVYNIPSIAGIYTVGFEFECLQSGIPMSTFVPDYGFGEEIKPTGVRSLQLGTFLMPDNISSNCQTVTFEMK